MSNDKQFHLRKIQSTYSLPDGMYRTSRNDYLKKEIKCVSSTSSQSISQKSSGSSKNSKGPETFIAKYKDNCRTMKSQPLSLVKVQFSNVFLDLIVDRIKLSDWMVILKTITEDKSLHFISLRSKIRGHVIQEYINTEKKSHEVNKGHVLYTRFLINKISESLGECLAYSKHLLCLQLHRVPLSGKGIQILGMGLKKTQSLQHLSLQYCDVGNEGCAILSQALRNVPTLITIDLSFCNISTVGAQQISELIKFQEIARLGECWKQSLRYREVDHDRIQGLRRITLNDNPNIGDVGLQYITDVLMDDFWVRALDMQNCGITEDGASLVRKLIAINNEIGVIDLRRNPLLNNVTVGGIIKILSKKITEEKAEYVWLDVNDNRVNNMMPPGSASNTVNNCGNRHGWNKSSSREKKMNSNLSALSSCSDIAINKVKRWKESSQNIVFENNFKSELKASMSSELNRIHAISKEEEIKKCDEIDVISCKSVATDTSDKECLEIIQTENEITKDIKNIFYDFIKFSSAKREKTAKQYPNVNYKPRKYKSDSD